MAKKTRAGTRSGAIGETELRELLTIFDALDDEPRARLMQMVRRIARGRCVVPVDMLENAGDAGAVAEEIYAYPHRFKN